MKKLLVVMLVLVTLCGTMVATAEGFEGFEGFDGLDIILIGTQQTNDDENAELHEGLTVTPSTWTISRTWPGKTASDENYVMAYLNVQIMNWTLSTLNIANSLSATLIYHEDYEFSGSPIFSLNSLGMLERLDGQFAFKIPLVVALANPDELEVVFHSLEAESRYPADLVAPASDLGEERFPFAFDRREGDIEFSLGDAYVTPSFEGMQDEVAKWLIQPVQIINWSHEPLELDEDVLSCMVIYAGMYGFRGTIRYPQAVIAPLEKLDAKCAIRLPVVVTEAKNNEVELSVTSQYSEYKETLDMKAAVRRANYYLESVENITYGFNYLGDGWYESTNTHVGNSFAMCVIRFHFQQGGSITISYNISSEDSYDFGMFSQLDQMLPKDNKTGGNVMYKFSNKSGSVTYTVSDSNEHFICLKYMKDGGKDVGNDSFRFRVTKFVAQ